MKSFVFSLARMRSYKEQLLEKEKGILLNLRRRKDEIEQQIDQLICDRAGMARAFVKRQQEGVTTFDLSAHSFLMQNSRQQLDVFRRDLERAEAACERQLRVVLAASQEVSALDKLEEKQETEFNYEQAKREELQLAEHITTGLRRRSGNTAQPGLMQSTD